MLNQVSYYQEMKIDYRSARIDDAYELKRLNDLFNGEGCNTLEDIEKSLKYNEREIVCVAAVGNDLVGFCCGQIFKSMCYPICCAEITELFVIDGHRRQGIGKNLLQFTEDILIKRGVKHFHILTGDKNTAAQALYRSCGYTDTNEILFDKYIANHVNYTEWQKDLWRDKTIDEVFSLAAEREISRID